MLVPLLFFCFGLAVGGLLRRVTIRLPQRIPLFHSEKLRCRECRVPLSFQRLLPLAPWWSRRYAPRCRACDDMGLKWLDPLAGALFSACAYVSPDLLITLVVISTLAPLMVIAFIDARHLIIPDLMLIGAALSSLVLHLSTLPAAVPYYVAVGLVSGAVMLGLRQIAGRLLGEEALGLGDVKLIMVGGFILGPRGVLLGVLVASGVALAFALMTRYRSGSLRRRPIAYGSFLSSVFIAAALANVQLLFQTGLQSVLW